MKTARILLVTSLLCMLTVAACTPMASSSSVSLEYQADLSQTDISNQEQVMNDIVKILKIRIAALGIKKSNVYREGQDRVIVQLPKGDLTDVQKERIGRTAILELREQVDVKDDTGTVTGQKWVPATATINGQTRVFNSNYFKSNTYITRNDTGQILLIFEWTSEGAQISKEVTTRLIGKPLGIFEGSGEDALPLLDNNGQSIAPTVQAVITDKGEITGLSFNEATQLSLQLNAGRMPVNLRFLGEMNN